MVGPDDFLTLDSSGDEATPIEDDLLERLSAAVSSGGDDTLVFGVGTLDEGGDGLVLSNDPLDPNDYKKYCCELLMKSMKEKLIIINDRIQFKPYI